MPSSKDGRELLLRDCRGRARGTQKKFGIIGKGSGASHRGLQVGVFALTVATAGWIGARVSSMFHMLNLMAPVK